MAATLSQIADGLADALGAISGLRVSTYQPDNPNPPVAWIEVEDVNYHGAMAGGWVAHTVNIQLLIGRVSDRAARNLLDGFMSYSGPQSVREAIETDRTLGGVVNVATVREGRINSAATIGDATYISAEIEVEVIG